MALMIISIMIAFLLLGFPMMVPLLVASLTAFVFYYPSMSPAIMVQQIIGGISPAALIAVPMFIFAADIMTKGQTANRLMDLVMAFVGHLRGGLPITSAVSCTLFGSVSGSTQATVVAIGGPLRPRLLAAGYPDTFAIALIINASDIALLIPPSIGMIVYGVVSGTSIGELFIAGVLPGLLILIYVLRVLLCCFNSNADPDAAPGVLGRTRAGDKRCPATTRISGNYSGWDLFWLL